jgi:hypothetical protein
VEPEQHDSFPEVLSHLFQHDPDPVAIAGKLARVLHDIEAVLTPILGGRGVAALVQRSLHLARATHPWLAEPIEVAQPGIDLHALESSFARHEAAEAASAALALLHSFHELLASLVGRPLAERLLEPVWARAPNSRTAQDIPT